MTEGVGVWVFARLRLLGFFVGKPWGNMHDRLAER